MGRVDEARRRSLATVETIDRTLDGSVGVAELTADAFPTEAAAEPVTPEPEVTEPSVSPVASPKVFDHLDPHLAQKVVVDAHMEPGSREQYRRLAATLHRCRRRAASRRHDRSAVARRARR